MRIGMIGAGGIAAKLATTIAQMEGSAITPSLPVVWRKPRPLRESIILKKLMGLTKNS
jgi:predicted dehydrogenase